MMTALFPLTFVVSVEGKNKLRRKNGKFFFEAALENSAIS
jgi:hypothetical protein